MDRATADNQSAQGARADQGVGQGPRRRDSRRGVCVAQSGASLARRGHRRQGRRSSIRSAGKNRRRHAQRIAQRARPRSLLLRSQSRRWFAQLESNRLV
jgi:hypothetical protein